MFGVLFATIITLIIVPSLYMTLEDVTNTYRKLMSFIKVKLSSDKSI